MKRDPLPDGDLIVARVDGLTAWLEPLSQLPDSPLARAARGARERLDGCLEVEGRCATGDCILVDQIACRSQSDGLAVAWERLGDWDWLLSRGAAGQRWSLRGRRGADGGLEAELDLPPSTEPGPSTLLLPATSGPGPGVLAANEALAHLRMRPDGGLDVASWLTADDMGARLFQLKSDLFLAAVLAGNWEVAVYLPEEGVRFPPMALALDFRSRAPAVAAMERLLEDVTATWPVRRDPYEVAGWQGECLGNLNVLPELSPCYVATDRALVAGWNAHSIELALAGPPADLDPQTSSGTIHLDRFVRADNRLARAYGGDVESVSTYPWERAVVRGGRQGDRFLFRIDLVAAAGPGGTP